MNRDILEGSWTQLTDKVKAQCGRLTGHQIERFKDRKYD